MRNINNSPEMKRLMISSGDQYKLSRTAITFLDIDLDVSKQLIVSIFDMIGYNFVQGGNRYPTLHIWTTVGAISSCEGLTLTGERVEQLALDLRHWLHSFILSLRMGDIEVSSEELNEASDGVICQVCLDEYEAARPDEDWWVRLLCCNNFMHSKCLTKVLLLNLPCPLCRSNKCPFCNTSPSTCEPIPNIRHIRQSPS